MCKVLKRRCFVMVLDIRSYVWLRSRCRHHHGFLKSFLKDLQPELTAIFRSFCYSKFVKFEMDDYDPC